MAYKYHYDVFVSHASLDKNSYVAGFVEALKQHGLTVFYDDNEIEWGESIRQKIDWALDNCLLAVVIISDNYTGRYWTEYELQHLVERQDREKRRIILPLLHRISKRDFVSRYPGLSEIKFKQTRSQSMDRFAEEIAEMVLLEEFD